MKTRLQLVPFSLTKYDTYVKKNVPFQLVNEQGNKCVLLARGCGKGGEHTMIERHYQCHGQERVEAFYVTRNGKYMYDKGGVFFLLGAEGIKKGDIIIEGGSPEENRFFFYCTYGGVAFLEGKYVGFGMSALIDCHGEQCHMGLLFYDNDKEYYIRKATEEEEEQYFKFMEKAGYFLDDDEGCWYHVPKVGEIYWTVELKNGRAIAVEHAPAINEEDRPVGHKLCYTWLANAEDMATKINKRIKGEW